MAFDQENCNFSTKDDFNGSVYRAFTLQMLNVIIKWNV